MGFGFGFGLGFRSRWSSCFRLRRSPGLHRPASELVPERLDLRVLPELPRLRQPLPRLLHPVLGRQPARPRAERLREALPRHVLVRAQRQDIRVDHRQRVVDLPAVLGVDRRQERQDADLILRVPRLLHPVAQPRLEQRPDLRAGSRILLHDPPRQGPEVRHQLEPLRLLPRRRQPIEGRPRVAPLLRQELRQLPLEHQPVLHVHLRVRERLERFDQRLELPGLPRQPLDASEDQAGRRPVPEGLGVGVERLGPGPRALEPAGLPIARAAPPVAPHRPLHECLVGALGELHVAEREREALEAQHQRGRPMAGLERAGGDLHGPRRIPELLLGEGRGPLEEGAGGGLAVPRREPLQPADGLLRLPDGGQRTGRVEGPLRAVLVVRAELRQVPVHHLVGLAAGRRMRGEVPERAVSRLPVVLGDVHGDGEHGQELLRRVGLRVERGEALEGFRVVGRVREQANPGPRLAGAPPLGPMEGGHAAERRQALVVLGPGHLALGHGQARLRALGVLGGGGEELVRVADPIEGAEQQARAIVAQAQPREASGGLPELGQE